MQGEWLIGLVAVAAAVQVFGINKSLQTSAKRALVHSKISSYRTPQCVFVCTVTPRSIAAGASPFCLDTKRTKKVIPIAISFFVYPIYFTQDGHQEVFLCLERGNTKINYGDTIRFMSNNSEIICN